MVSRPIAYNLVRLILSAAHTTPRGVDRIDFGYLSYLIDHWPADLFGVMPSAIGHRCFDRARLLKARERLLHLWQEESDADHDPALARVVERFGRPDVPDPPPKPRSFLPDIAGLRRILALLFGDGIHIGIPVNKLPARPIYLDVGHFGLTFPGAFGWRQDRPDISPVFMIHDVIPLEIPDMIDPETVKAHRRVMNVARQHARALIAPTKAAAAAIGQELNRQAPSNIPIYPVPLPLDGLFLNGVSLDPELGAHPYFVICGAIEPRKNHRLLIEIWRRLVSERGSAAPRLIVAGSPGYASADILATFLHDEALRGRVILASGLSSPALARLMAGARAILMPSLAEGFGLPPAEGLALGTPAILSDIPAHREAVGRHGIFLDPHDTQAWRNEIERLLDAEAFAVARNAASGFRPKSWPSYMGEIAGILSQIEE